MCRQWVVLVAGDDAFGQVRRKEALQLSESLQLGELRLHALLQVGIERSEFSCLSLDRVVEGFHPQERAHARQQFRGIDRLHQEIVGTGFETLDAFFRRVERRHHDDRQHRGGSAGA